MMEGEQRERKKINRFLVKFILIINQYVELGFKLRLYEIFIN